MSDKDRDLTIYRLSLAKETLENAKLCLDNKYYRDCINRSYYAAFYAIKAVLAVESIDFKRHKDAVGYFNKQYVATELFPRDVGKYLGRLKTVREASDYNDFFICSQEEALRQYQAAEYIIGEVETYLNSEIGDNFDFKI
jgi:uncharacterized protein (UPF0332 family)